MTKQQQQELETMKVHGAKSGRMSEILDSETGTVERMMSSEEKVQKALMHLILHKPFFGALIMKLQVGPDTRAHPTMWTDGRVLRYNRQYIAEVSFDHLVASLAKEVAHCALTHPYRR